MIHDTVCAEAPNDVNAKGFPPHCPLWEINVFQISFQISMAKVN